MVVGNTVWERREKLKGKSNNKSYKGTVLFSLKCMKICIFYAFVCMQGPVFGAKNCV